MPSHLARAKSRTKGHFWNGGVCNILQWLPIDDGSWGWPSTEKNSKTKIKNTPKVDASVTTSVLFTDRTEVKQSVTLEENGGQQEKKGEVDEEKTESKEKK